MITSPVYEEKRLRILAELTEGRTVLDLGYAQQPNPYLRGVHRVGVDLKRPSSGPEYEEQIVGDVTHVDELLAGRTFDTILCGELIEHLENPYAFLRRLRTLLATDGRLVLSTPNPLAFPVVIAEALQLHGYFYTRDHLYYFLPRWVDRLLEATGYHVEMKRAVGLWTPWFVVSSPVALSYQVVYVARAS